MVGCVPISHCPAPPCLARVTDENKPNQTREQQKAPHQPLASCTERTGYGSPAGASSDSAAGKGWRAGGGHPRLAGTKGLVDPRPPPVPPWCPLSPPSYLPLLWSALPGGTQPGAAFLELKGLITWG